MRDVMGPQSRERDRVSRLSRATSDAAGSLRVVRRGRGNVPHENRPQVAHVDAKLERGGTAEHVDFTFDELALDFPRLLGGELGRMLLNVQRERLFLIGVFVVAVFTPSLSKGHSNHFAVAFRRGANAMRVQMSFAAACIAAVNDVVVRMRIHRPDILAKPKFLFLANKEILSLEETPQVLPQEHKDVL